MNNPMQSFHIVSKFNAKKYKKIIKHISKRGLNVAWGISALSAMTNGLILLSGFIMAYIANNISQKQRFNVDAFISSFTDSQFTEVSLFMLTVGAIVCTVAILSSSLYTASHGDEVTKLRHRCECTVFMPFLYMALSLFSDNIAKSCSMYVLYAIIFLMLLINFCCFVGGTFVVLAYSRKITHQYHKAMLDNQAQFNIINHNN